MPRNHLVAIGGSGQHVALAYLDLWALAQGVLVERDPPQLFLLDRDSTASASKTAWQEALHQRERLNQVAASRWADPGSIEAFSTEAQHSRTVAEAVSPNYGPLYFTRKQLDVSFTKGYYGQAPVAAAFFGAYCAEASSEAGQALYRLAAGGGTVFVAGSVVGGTGAGCLPSLTEFLARRDNCQVMASVLLNWFALNDPAGTNAGLASERNDQMRSREPSALVYARERLAKSAATILVGQPVQAPRERPWQGDTQQAVHDDLTLPYYCAAAATNFHFANGIPPDRGLYAFAAPLAQELEGKEASDGPLTLAPGMVLFGGDTATPKPIEQLGNLVEANLELCKRLSWVATYLARPPATSATWFRRAHRVPALDGLSAERRREVLDLLHQLLDAKWAALRRIAASGQSLIARDQVGGSWAAAGKARGLENGLLTLDDWLTGARLEAEVSAKETLRAIVASVLGGITTRLRVRKEPASPRRLLPAPLRGDDTAPAAVEPGSLERMDIPATDRYIDYDRIDPTTLPTPQAVEFLLDRAFSGKLGQKEPKGLTQWRERWRILLTGIALGRFELVPGKPDEGHVALVPRGDGNPPKLQPPQWFVRDVQEDTVVGYSSPRTLVVPAVSADWNRLAAALGGGNGLPALPSVFGWIEFMVELHERLGDARECPPWLRAARAWMEDGRGGTRIEGTFGLTARELEAAWTSTETKRIRLPTNVKHTHVHLDTMLANSFGIPVENIAFEEAPRLVEELKTVLDAKHCPVYVPFGPGTDGLRRRVLWDRGSGALDPLRFGVFFFKDPDTGKLRLGRIRDATVSDIEILVPNDVLLDEVERLKDGKDGPLLPDFPVKLRYAGLVDSARPHQAAPLAGEVALYRFHLRGLPEMQEHRPTVTGNRGGSFLLWPRFRLAGPTPAETFRAYYLLADANVDTDEVWVVGRSCAPESFPAWWEKRASVASAQPLYRIDPATDDVTGGVPEFLTLVNAPGDTLGWGIGLFQLKLTGVARLEPEHWGVDFGSSSSVVAVGGTAGVGDQVSVALAPHGDLDQTLVLAVDQPIPVEGCQWFPTWDRKAPRLASTARPLFPSQLILTGPSLARSQTVHAEKLRYGTDFVIDHGGSLDSRFTDDDEKIVRDLKWIESIDAAVTERERSLRRAYLIHLLELCFCMRASLRDGTTGISPGLPARIEARFTLPIAMLQADLGDLSQDQLLAEDVERVCGILSRLLGRTVSHSFLWESHAGTTIARIPNDVYAVADLGGGSLDMWGALGESSTEYADSYRFGGHDLLRQWANTIEQACSRLSLHRDLQMGKAVRLVLGGLGNDELGGKLEAARHGYFELAREATARWIAGLARAKVEESGAKQVVVHLSLLGMGWGLDDSALRDPASYAQFVDVIARRAAALLGSRIRLTVQPDEFRHGEWRKTFLARNAGWSRTRSMTKEQLHAARPVTMFGFDLELGPEPLVPVAWFSRTDSALRTTPGPVRAAFHAGSTIRQPTPELADHPMSPTELASVLFDLKRFVKPTQPIKYFGPSPMALVLGCLRHNTAPRSPEARAATMEVAS